MRLIPTSRPTAHAQHGAPSHTLLMLLRELPLVAGDELAHEATLAAQRRGADFRARHVPQIVLPINFEAQVVVGVHHFWD